MKRKILSLAFCILALNSMTVRATDLKESNIEYSELIYNTEEINTQEYEITSMKVSKDNIVIEYSGESEFIDVIATFPDGSEINISDCADWDSSDNEVAFADRGRVLALNAGSAEITVSFGEFSQKIIVKVTNKIDIADIIDELNDGIVLLSSSMETARDMVEYQWTPTSDVRGWRNKKTFKANTTYMGIPYSQTANQVNKQIFENAMKTTDFYANYTRTLNGETIIMPKYGNDCSGFVSFAWGISRQTTSSFISGIKNGTYTKVGNYDANNPTSTDLKASYKNLSAGDAVVKNGHTFLIASNDTKNSKVYAYEQTPYVAVYTTWTYDSMANAKYMPFRN